MGSQRGEVAPDTRSSVDDSENANELRSVGTIRAAPRPANHCLGIYDDRRR